MKKTTPALVLKAGRHRRLQNHHPFVYRNDVAEMRGHSDAGEVGDVLDEAGRFVAKAFLNPNASVVARVLSLKDESIDHAFFARRIQEALHKRHSIQNTSAMRVINAESDMLPGLIVDKFGDFLSIQLRNAGMDKQRDVVLAALQDVLPTSSALERSDTQERRKEGLRERVGTLWGNVPERVEFFEDDLQLGFSPNDGQKTGFFLDQRDNRRRMANLVDEHSQLLDVYSYTGGFSLHAAKRGARSTAIDKDPVALDALMQQAEENHLDGQIHALQGDALKALDHLLERGERFSHAIIDPPTLAKRKEDVTPAKRIFTIATKNVLRMLLPGGMLAVSTCAFHLKLEDLIEATRIAAGDAGRRLSVVNVTFQPDDHPWILQVPETLYLKTLWCRVE